MNAIRRHYIVALASIVSLFIGLGLALGRDHTDPGGFVTGTVERGSISTTVSATGTLEAVRTVQVGSQISGQVAGLFADYNSIVKKGQLLARIDARTFQTQVASERAQVQSAQAQLEAGKADLANQEANLAQADANVDAAKAAQENARLSFERAQQLMDRGLIAQADYDLARTNADSAAAKVAQAEAAVRQAQAAIRSKEAQLTQGDAQISSAKAALERADLSLDLTSIYSPVDGVVISRNVDIGQTVAASLSAPTLFVIANDLTRMQVKASIDEADIGKVVQGAPVQFTVDAYPKDSFHGAVGEIRLEPQTVQNVVTYNVIVAVANPEMKLKPGMTANISVIAASRENVLTVPNSALRFTPAGSTAVKNAVWTVDAAGQVHATTVQLGLSDGIRSEILGSGFHEGEELLIGNRSAASSSSAATPPANNPAMPFGLGARPGSGLRRGGR